MNYRISLIALPLLTAALPAHASEQSAQSGPALEEAAAAGDTIVVTANRTARPIDTVGQAITVLDTATIEQRQSVTVADLLRQTPGVSVARNGGIGGVTSVFIRGAESDQTVALIDGVKINDPSSPGGGFNFGELLIGNIARIEVLRGAESVLWGSQAIGGVVNMITRQPTEALTVNARGEGGWHGTGQGVANVAGRVGPVSASLGGGYFTTEGTSAAAVGTERDGYRNYGANGSVNIALADAVSVDLRGFYSNGRADYDGFAPPTFAFGDTQEYSETEQWVGYGGLNVALFDGKFRNRFAYARTQVNRATFDAAQTPAETFRARGRNERLEYQGNVDLNDAVRATFGAEREVSRLFTDGFGAVSNARARIWGVYGQLSVMPVTGLTVSGGVRHDDHDRFGGATTASASGAYTPNGGNTVLRASYSEGYKVPSLYQLFGDYGNRTLRPERSHGWDAGVTQRALDGAVEASATWFHRTSTDLISFVSCAAGAGGICTNRPFGTYDNIARARAQGLELALALRPVEALTVSGAYTYLDAQNRSPGSASFGRALARRPSQSVTMNADYRWPIGLTTGATVTAVGDSLDASAPRGRLDGYVLTDARVSFPLGEHVELYGRVENLFGERYQTAAGYGTPGRAAYGGVRLRY
jgi:vitamin B12 transporter